MFLPHSHTQNVHMFWSLSQSIMLILCEWTCQLPVVFGEVIAMIHEVIFMCMKWVVACWFLEMATSAWIMEQAMTAICTGHNSKHSWSISERRKLWLFWVLFLSVSCCNTIIIGNSFSASIAVKDLAKAGVFASFIMLRAFSFNLLYADLWKDFTWAVALF